VIKTFKHSGLQRFFEKGSKAGIRPEHAKRLKVILTSLSVAAQPSDMNAPGSRLHEMKPNMPGGCSVTVSGNWRVFFEFSGTDVVEVDYYYPH
jgi:proteic killer suppression protein